MNRPFSPFPALETERLLLKQMTGGDANALFAYQSDAANFPYVDMPVYSEQEEASAFIKRINSGIRESKWIYWGIFKKTGGPMIGTICIWDLDEKKNTAEVGYGIYPAYRGSGFMCEALRAVASFALQDMALAVLEAYTNVDNAPSRRVLERCGFTCQREHVDTWADGTDTQMAVYAITPKAPSHI